MLESPLLSAPKLSPKQTIEPIDRVHLIRRSNERRSNSENAHSTHANTRNKADEVRANGTNCLNVAQSFSKATQN